MSINLTSETRRLARQDESNEFYLGVRDEGTCGSVVRVIAYYLVCPTREQGLVSYTDHEFALPVRSSSNIKYNAGCADNAHNVTTVEVVASSETASCYLTAPAGPMCWLHLGCRQKVLSRYIEYSQTCLFLNSRKPTVTLAILIIILWKSYIFAACAAGTFHSDSLPNDLCQPCPANTMTSKVAATECSCISGFYRSVSQFKDQNLIVQVSQWLTSVDLLWKDTLLIFSSHVTEPPTACTDLHVVALTSNSLTISWSRPAITGRKDYFYKAFHSDPTNSSEFIVVTDSFVNTGSTVTYEVMGLLPVTLYLVWVTTHNGVSDQDPQNDHLRMQVWDICHHNRRR